MAQYKSVATLGYKTNCIHKKFFYDRPDLFEKFFKINNFIDISSEMLEELTERLGVSWDLLKDSQIYCCSPEKEYENVHTFPFYWLYCMQYEDFDLNTKKHKKFITMNAAPSGRRTEFISQLKDNNLLDDCYYSFWPDKKLPSELKAKKYQNVRYKFPIEWHDSLYEFNIETAGETGDPYKVISEKTFRPLLCGKPFLNYGYPGMYNKLKQWGFKFEADLEFDKDIPNRFDLYVNEVKRLVNTPVNKTIIEENKKVIKSIREKNIKKHTKWQERIHALRYCIFLDNEMIRYLRNV